MNIVISNSSNLPIYEQIYSQIKNKIISGELESGDVLPSIRTLAKDLRISVITTKRAYDELEKVGFINSVAGKGCFVANQNVELIRENNLKKIECYLSEISKLAKNCNLSYEDLIKMIRMLEE
ncbi:MAG: GntR family transcriptional regulator [Oscillospiraceae bacterium]